MKKIFLLSAAFFCLFAFSCKKENSEPNDPSYHQDVFRCKVNGQPWTFSGGGGPFGGPSSLNVKFYVKRGDLGFLSYREENEDRERTELNFGVDSLKVGNNPIRYWRRIFVDYAKPGGCLEFALDTTRYHNLTLLEIDTTAKRLKGTYEMHLINKCGEEVIITDGEFDVVPFWFEY